MITGVVRSVWEFFCPPDPPFSEIFARRIDPVKVEGHMRALFWWRVKVSVTLSALVVGVIISAFTPWGFVKAGELDKKLDEAVQKAVKDVKADIASVKAQQDQMAPAIVEILKSTTATSICRIVTRRKTERNPTEQEALRADLDKEQAKYKTLTGEAYPESRCGSN